MSKILPVTVRLQVDEHRNTVSLINTFQEFLNMIDLRLKKLIWVFPNFVKISPCEVCSLISVFYPIWIDKGNNYKL